MMDRIAPSDFNPWEGAAVEGETYTREQLLRMDRENPQGGDFGHCDHSVPAVNNMGSHVGFIRIPCPVVARTRDGRRHLIIRPCGDTKWVNVQNV